MTLLFFANGLGAFNALCVLIFLKKKAARALLFIKKEGELQETKPNKPEHSWNF
jgi:hypothetical protein